MESIDQHPVLTHLHMPLRRTQGAVRGGDREQSNSEEKIKTRVSLAT